MTALTQAQEIADRILARAKGLEFTGEKEHEETELESYLEFLDEHEVLIEELMDLKQQLDETELASEEFEKVKATIAESTNLYKIHLNIFEHLHRSAQSSYKEIKQGQRINKGYRPIQGDEASSSFDIKQ